MPFLRTAQSQFDLRTGSRSGARPATTRKPSTDTELLERTYQDFYGNSHGGLNPAVTPASQLRRPSADYFGNATDPAKKPSRSEPRPKPSLPSISVPKARPSLRRLSELVDPLDLVYNSIDAGNGIRSGDPIESVPMTAHACPDVHKSLPPLIESPSGRLFGTSDYLMHPDRPLAIRERQESIVRAMQAANKGYRNGVVGRDRADGSLSLGSSRKGSSAGSSVFSTANSSNASTAPSSRKGSAASSVATRKSSTSSRPMHSRQGSTSSTKFNDALFTSERPGLYDRNGSGVSSLGSSWEVAAASNPSRMAAAAATAVPRRPSAAPSLWARKPSGASISTTSSSANVSATDIRNISTISGPVNSRVESNTKPKSSRGPGSLESERIAEGRKDYERKVSRQEDSQPMSKRGWLKMFKASE